jgi:hypothetical protein
VARRQRFILDPSLEKLAYRCWPDGCPRGFTCCVGLTVEVSRREVRAIDSLMDELAKLKPTLREGRKYATGRDVPSVKPAACRHWPVALVTDGDAIRVTVQPAARRIGCVAPRRELPGQPSVLEAYREEILEMCGPAIRRLLP